MKHVADLLFAPARFFSAMEGKKPGLGIPVLIAVIGAAISALAAYAMSDLYAGMFAAAGTGMDMGMFMGLVGAAGAFIGFIVIWWVVLAGAFYVVSIPFRGKGSFSRTLAATGYGLVPTVIGSALSAVSLLSYLPRITVPVIRNIQDPAIIQAAITKLMQDPAMQEYTLVSTAFTIVFLVWSANIWIFGMKYARELNTRNACITVLVPVGIIILYHLVTILAKGFFMGGS
ncbi:MAG: Yip1 family protein [Methanolinea sp.]|jgi:hypothetical protein|nr:Yip1 family protein [Methanolinea sp.]